MQTSYGQCQVKINQRKLIWQDKLVKGIFLAPLSDITCPLGVISLSRPLNCSYSITLYLIAIVCGSGHYSPSLQLGCTSAQNPTSCWRCYRLLRIIFACIKELYLPVSRNTGRWLCQPIVVLVFCPFSFLLTDIYTIHFSFLLSDIYTIHCVFSSFVQVYEKVNNFLFFCM